MTTRNAKGRGHCKEPCPDHLCLEMTKAGMCGYREPGPTIAELIARSSLGAALDDINTRGIDAHAADLARETRPRRRRKRP